MLPITSHAALPDRSRGLKTADGYLARVLAGEEYLVFDGAMGTMLQKKGLKPGKFSLTTVLPTFRTVSKPKLSRAVTYITAASEPDTR